VATARAARLTHLGLPVTDLDKSVAFYEKWAGMKVQSHLDDPMGIKGARLAQKSGGFVLSLLVGPMPVTMPGGMHLGLECGTKAEVDKLAADAKKAGILTYGPVDSGNELGYQAYIADPDGNSIEFAFGQKVGITEG
jgi:catechol 2,3-dioxygenase-like lactoylglutathione lyase family enzyme